MKTNRIILSLAALVILSVNTCSATKTKVEVSQFHNIKIRVTKAALYAAPFVLSACIVDSLYANKKLQGTFLGLYQTSLARSLLVGVFATYFWPEADKIKYNCIAE